MVNVIIVFSYNIITLALFLLSLKNDTVIFGLEPLHGVFFGNLVIKSNLAGFSSPVSNIVSSSTKNNEKVEAVDTDRRVVLNAQVDVLLNTKTEITSC